MAKKAKYGKIKKGYIKNLKRFGYPLLFVAVTMLSEVVITNFFRIRNSTNECVDINNAWDADLNDTAVRSPASHFFRCHEALNLFDSPLELAFVDAYLTREPTTEAQNLHYFGWLKDQMQYGRKMLVFIEENIFMKILNDVSGKKNLISALNNKRKEIMLEELSKLKLRNSNLEYAVFSDYKSFHLAIRSKTGSVDPKLEAELISMQKEVSRRFDEFLKANAHLSLSGKLPESSDWFRAGIGPDIEMANLVARHARLDSYKGPRTASFRDPSVIRQLNIYFEGVELQRKFLTDQLQGTELVEMIEGTGKLSFTQELFEIIRKSSNEKELIDAIGLDYPNVKMNFELARDLMHYVDNVNDFTPALLIAKRQLASLVDAKNGGLTVDFSGMGSFNIKVTADAMARSKNLEQCLVRVRQAEIKLTNEFIARKIEIRRVVESVLGRSGIEFKYAESGDDLVIKPNKVILPELRIEILQGLARIPESKKIRLTIAPAHIEDGVQRAMLSVHGELIEKKLRKKLRGQIPTQVLEKLIFMVDMQSKTLNKGYVQLLVGLRSGANLDSDQRTLVSETFKQTLKAFNKEIRDQNKKASYGALETLF